MSGNRNWSIANGDGMAYTANAESQTFRLGPAGGAVGPAGDLRIYLLQDLLIDNPGPLDVYVSAGQPGVVATVHSLRVPANSLQPYRKGRQISHLAIITKGGSQGIVVHLGEGK